MQNSNLSAKIFPNIKEDWLSFIERVSKKLQDMIMTYNNDKRRVKDLNGIINKLKEIREISKDNIEKILNYREFFMYIDNSLEDSFDALEYFKKQDNLDNIAVREIYERIVNSPKIMQINSEYNGLAIKIQFDKDRIKRLSDLICGNKVDYALIRELINKYKYPDDKKKNILFYPVVMLSIKQNEIKNSKENSLRKKEEKEKFYHERFNELCKVFQEAKENTKELSIRCFNAREKMDQRDIDMYTSFANNPNEIDEYEFTDDIKFNIYTLAFFKIKKDIENFIDGINDLSLDENDLDDELAFFQEMIDEFNSVVNKLNTFISEDEQINSNELESNVFFALDAFHRLIIDEKLLNKKNRGSIKALIEKASSTSSSKINGLKTIHMLGVGDAEKILDKNISLLVTSKLMIAYVMVGKNILIIAGDENNNDRFDKMVNRIVERNAISIKRQIALIDENNLDYIDLQNKIIKSIIGEEEKEKVI